MIWPELIIIPLIISLFYFYLDWQPKRFSFFSMGKFIKIGHRGAPSLAHENTLNSFIKAVENAKIAKGHMITHIVFSFQFNSGIFLNTSLFLYIETMQSIIKTKTKPIKK